MRASLPVRDVRVREARQKRQLRLCAVATLAAIVALCIMAGAALGIVAPGMWSNVMTAIRAKGEESDAVRFVRAQRAATRWGWGGRGEGGSCKMGRV